MNKELLGKFLKDFHIVTQDEDQEFPYANPSDAARSLIKARNWVGTLTERLMDLTDRVKVLKGTLRKQELSLTETEREILSRCVPVPAWATKNKEIQKSYILANADKSEKVVLVGIEDNRSKTLTEIDTLETEIGQYNQLLKSLERTTDWIIEYINWMKFEARSLNG